MRAYALTDENATLALVDVPTPEPGPGEVRVRIHAASVNGFDLAVAGGLTKGMMEHRYPLVLGKDFAGVLDAVADGVEEPLALPECCPTPMSSSSPRSVRPL